jgi:hypothetical protein
MAGTTNFLQQNPGAANQENDATYAADPLTTGGVGVDDLLPSPWLNKIWFQCTTFICAIAYVIANWGSGFTITDTSLSVLKTNLTNFFTGLQNGAAAIQNAGLSGSRSLQVITSGSPQATPPSSPNIYQNTAALPKLVTVSVDSFNPGGGDGFWGAVFCDATTTPSTLVAMFARVNAGTAPGLPVTWPASVTFLVPAGYYYGITVLGGDTSSNIDIQTWTEWTY